jgi:hypothetical protein
MNLDSCEAQCSFKEVSDYKRVKLLRFVTQEWSTECKLFRWCH